jgi:histidinol-phosphate aminotransferase
MDFSLPTVAELRRGGRWDFKAALTFVTTPNAPSGRGYATAELDQLCRAQRGVVILDETYVDFAEENALELALKQPHVLVARTFSKAYSLCFQRVGYFVGHAGLIAAVDKVRDSYNVNGLGQIAAAATLDHLPYYRATSSASSALANWSPPNWGSLALRFAPARPISSWSGPRVFRRKPGWPNSASSASWSVGSRLDRPGLPAHQHRLRKRDADVSRRLPTSPFQHAESRINVWACIWTITS